MSLFFASFYPLPSFALSFFFFLFFLGKCGGGDYVVDEGQFWLIYNWAGFPRAMILFIRFSYGMEMGGFRCFFFGYCPPPPFPPLRGAALREKRRRNGIGELSSGFLLCRDLVFPNYHTYIFFFVSAVLCCTSPPFFFFFC